MRASALAVVAALLLGGCVWRSEVPMCPTFAPAPADPQGAATVYFAHHLRAADTLQYRMGDAYRAYRYKPIFDGSGVDWKGWAVDAEVHLRDESGALGPWKTWHLQ